MCFSSPPLPQRNSSFSYFLMPFCFCGFCFDLYDVRQDQCECMAWNIATIIALLTCINGYKSRHISFLFFFEHIYDKCGLCCHVQIFYFMWTCPLILSALALPVILPRPSEEISELFHLKPWWCTWQSCSSDRHKTVMKTWLVWSTLLGASEAMHTSELLLLMQLLPFARTERNCLQKSNCDISVTSTFGFHPFLPQCVKDGKVRG